MTRYKGRVFKYGDNINTDVIFPGKYTYTVTDRKEMAKHALEDLDPEFIKTVKPGDIIVGGKNFGCGSSREHAPQAIMRWGRGIKAVVGESFAEIFFGNCVALGIPCVTVNQESAEKLMTLCESSPGVCFEVDLKSMVVRAGEFECKAGIGDGPRQQFLEGRWDTTAELLAARDLIAAKTAQLPYFRNWR